MVGLGAGKRDSKWPKVGNNPPAPLKTGWGIISPSNLLAPTGRWKITLAGYFFPACSLGRGGMGSMRSVAVREVQVIWLAGTSGTRGSNGDRGTGGTEGTRRE